MCNQLVRLDMKQLADLYVQQLVGLRAQLIHLDVQQLLGLNVAADRYTVHVQQLLGLHVQQLSSC
jgi:hypothetical protein